MAGVEVGSTAGIGIGGVFPDGDDIFPAELPACDSLERLIAPDPMLEQDSTAAGVQEREDAVIGSGIENMGNTCFLSVILQCLTHTVPLLQSLQSCRHLTPCIRMEHGLCAICAMRDHVNDSLASSGAAIRPQIMMNSLKYISPSFGKAQQEDAHEFFQYILDRLDTCSPQSNEDDVALHSGDENIVNQVFGGSLRSQLKCSECGYCSECIEPLNDVSLEVDSAYTLADALKMFFGVEKIEYSEGNYTCAGCKMGVMVEKQYTVKKAPTVAAFHLKRFKHNGYFTEKINHTVEFPLELDLSSLLTNPADTGDSNYNLYGVVVHVGKLNSFGHYVCYIRSSPSSWFRFNDSQVTRVSQEDVLSEKAYMLFYANKETPWFSTFMETQPRPCFRVKSNVLQAVKNKVCLKRAHEKISSDFDDDYDDVLDDCNLGRILIGDVSEIKVDEITRTEIPSRPVSSEVCFSTKDNCEASKSSSDSKLDGNSQKVGDKSSAVPFSTLPGSREVYCSPPSTPPRSPSPEAVFEQLPDVKHAILNNRPRAAGREERHKPAQTVAGTAGARSLHKFMRTMPASRREALMPFLPPARKCQTETLRKKRKLLDENGCAIRDSMFSPIRSYATSHQ